MVVGGNFNLSGGTVNGVAYLNGSKNLTTGSALTFDGYTLNSPQFYQSVSAPTTYSTQVIENTASNGYSQFLFNVGVSGANGQASISYAPSIFFAIGPTSDDTTTPIVFRNNNATERMRITSAGNVGIGTTTPNAKLTVASAGEAIRMVGSTPYLTFVNASQTTRFGYIQQTYSCWRQCGSSNRCS